MTRHAGQALLALVALGVSASAGAAACAARTGVVVEVTLADACMTGALPPVRLLRAEVMPCAEDPEAPTGYRCTVASEDELVPLMENEFIVTPEQAASNEPLKILVEDLSDVAARGVLRIRLALSGFDEGGLLVAYGSADVAIEPAVVVEQTDPLVLWGTCGLPAGSDYDGDGAVGWLDCAPFDPTFVGGAPEICGNGIDEDCFMYDLPCDGPVVNRGDQDGDGHCAIGADLVWANDPSVTLYCATRAYDDCDDTDPAVLETCRCTDLDGDGYCEEAAGCAHAIEIECNPFGGDCCDQAGDPGCIALLEAYEVNPGAAELCDGLDRNCSGAGWDLVASPCFASGATGACEQGILCAMPGEPYGCRLPEAPAPAEGFLCGGSGGVTGVACVDCGMFIGWDVVANGPCSTGASLVEVPAPVTTMTCTWSPVSPSFPLVVSEAGSDCATGRFSVDLTWVPGPGLYAFYERFDDEDAGSTHAVVVLVEVGAGTCGVTSGLTVCTNASLDLCQGF